MRRSEIIRSQSRQNCPQINLKLFSDRQMLNYKVYQGFAFQMILGDSALVSQGFQLGSPIGWVCLSFPILSVFLNSYRNKKMKHERRVIMVNNKVALKNPSKNQLTMDEEILQLSHKLVCEVVSNHRGSSSNLYLSYILLGSSIV